VIGALPYANFTANVTSGTEPLAVQFTDISTGPITGANWSFGDGSTSSARNPAHVYTSPGDYSVSLTVGNGNEEDTRVRTDYIHVESQAADYTIPLSPGWNFVSTPRTLQAGYDTAYIFRHIDTAGHSIWQYDASGRRWVVMTAASPVNVLDGIWIYSAGTDEIGLTFSRDPLRTPPTKACYQGWNAIGFPDVSESPAKLTLNSVRDDWTQVIGFDAEGQVYEVSLINGATGIHSDNKAMRPTKGYWLYMIQGDELAAISA
jgi:PKD repeat protein